MDAALHRSKNDDPDGCPATTIGRCEAVCARFGRDMDRPALDGPQHAAVLALADELETEGLAHTIEAAVVMDDIADRIRVALGATTTTTETETDHA